MLSGASARPSARLLGCALAAGYSLEIHWRACMPPISRARRADCTCAALVPTGAATLSEFVPAAHHLLERRTPGDGFYPAESSTFKLFGETLNANGGTGEDWGQDGKELAVTIAQDLVQLGPFAAVQRFGTMAPRQASAFQHCDGVLGLAYSPVEDSASLLKSLLTSARPSWHVEQPKTREMLAPAVFSLLTTEVGGELHLGGYDAAAAKGPVHFVDMMTDSGYTVAVTGMEYGGHELLRDRPRTDDEAQPAASSSSHAQLRGLFDSGSACLELPDRRVGNLQASPFRALLGAHMKYGQQALAFTLADSRGRSARIVLPYDSWTHPLGCLGPYAGMSWTYCRRRCNAAPCDVCVWCSVPSLMALLGEHDACPRVRVERVGLRGQG